MEPMSARDLKVLELARGHLEPPSGVEGRVFQALQASIAALPPLPSAPEAAPSAAGAAGSPLLSAASGMLTPKAVAVIAGAMLAVGGAGGVMLGRTVLAPEAPAPRVIEKVVRVEVPAPAAAAASPRPSPTPAPPPATAPVPVPRKAEPLAHVEQKQAAPVADELLAQERELIETARSALLHADADAALAALGTHTKRFPQGRLDEERESLWVQALVMKGSVAEARAKAAQFHQKFPRSLLGATVDAAVTEP